MKIKTKDSFKFSDDLDSDIGEYFYNPSNRLYSTLSLLDLPFNIDDDVSNIPFKDENRTP